MNHNLEQIKQLRERLDVFLSKLWEQAEEIISQAKTVAPEPTDTDPAEFHRSCLAFEAALRKQMREIVQRGQKIFQERFEVYVDSTDPTIRAAYADAEAAIQQLEKDIELATDEVFAPFTDYEAERQFRRAVADWEKAAENFHCKHCSNPLPVEHLYYQAQYVPCPKCGKQTTFTPTPAMQQAPQWAEAIADYRTARFKEKVDLVAATPGGWAGQVMTTFIDYALKRHRHLIEILPNYAPTQVDSLRRAVFVEAHRKEHTRIEPAGTREADITYYNLIGSLGDTLKTYRAHNDPVFAEIIEGIVRDLARPDCEVATAVLNNTFTHQLWAKYSRIAHQQPEASLPLDAASNIRHSNQQ